jgi:hypothetical protein
VTARTSHPDAKPPAAERLMSDPLETATIHCDELAAAVLPGRSLEQVADASEIALTLFTDISNRHNRPAKLKTRFTGRPERPQYGYQAASIVGNPGHEEGLVLSPKLDRHSAGKDCVEVSGNDNRRTREVFVSRDYIADLVH